MAPDVADRLRAALAVPGDTTSDFDLNPEHGPTPARVREAGVLVGVDPSRDGGRMVLTVRGPGLKRHPGQIAFPGGKVESTDAGIEAAALREAAEEIGLPRDGVEVLGRLPPHLTVTGFRMTPVVGLIRPGFAPRAEVGEVEDIFWVPLAHVGDPDAFTVQSRRWHGGRRAYYAVPWGPYYIWGATARVLRGLADRLASAG